MITAVAPGRESFLADFERLGKTLPGQGLPWFKALRERAIARFGELGFPTDKDENWKFTSVKQIEDAKFSPLQNAGAKIDAEGVKNLSLCQFDTHRLVFVDGHFAPELSGAGPFGAGCALDSLARLVNSDPDKLEPHLNAAALSAGGVFAALNTAFFADGAVVKLREGFICDKPIHLLFISTAGSAPAVSYPRVLIKLESGAKAALIEEYATLGSGTAWTNAVTDVVVGENARLDHYRLGRESGRALHVGATRVRQERNSSYSSHAITLGGLLVRNDLDAVLAGEGAECALNGLYMTAGRSHVDNHTTIDHAQPHTTSRELYKGVLDGDSRAVFNGTIVVRPGSQKISSVQANKNLVLSEGGLVHTKPEFKIFANDVQCRHGATIGQLSADALFYLRSRGIGPQAARELLIYAFVSEMVGLVGVEPLKRVLAERLSASLPESLPAELN